MLYADYHIEQTNFYVICYHRDVATDRTEVCTISGGHQHCRNVSWENIWPRIITETYCSLSFTNMAMYPFNLPLNFADMILHRELWQFVVS